MNQIRQRRGFTLIEMLIVLGIIASLMSFGVNVVGSNTNDMRDTSRNFIRLIRYMYNQAAVKNEYYRLVINLEEQKYFAQYSAEPFYVVREGDETEALRISNELEGKSGDEEEAAAEAAVNVGAFSEAEDDLLEIFKVPEGIKIASVYVMHRLDKVEEGKVYLYFFPKGMTEFAVIHLSDLDEENFMSLIVNPLTGSVEIKDDYVEHEEILSRYD